MPPRWVAHRLPAVLALLAACGAPAPAVELHRYPLDALSELIAKDGVELDPSVSSDGHGSLKIQASEPRTVRLVETGHVDAEAARLVYRARLRTEGVQGKVYLEMWCVFDGQGEFFSRALAAPLSGTNDWSSQETPFLLQKGQNPSNVKLNVVIDGRGTVWIDDLELLKGPLG